MKLRSPTVVLTADEVARLRTLVDARGTKEAAKVVGLADERTLFKAALRLPISRLSAQVIRHSLSRI